jgi:hypothetical protein
MHQKSHDRLGTSMTAIVSWRLSQQAIQPVAVPTPVLTYLLAHCYDEQALS